MSEPVGLQYVYVFSSHSICSAQINILYCNVLLLIFVDGFL